jgi:acetyltransferase-like isoleucine patch superfamily enzyme
MQTIINYLKLIPRLFYFLFNFSIYKNLNLRTIVFFSVRVQGKKYISIGRNSVIQRGGWLLAIKIDDTDPILEIGDNCAIGDYCHIASVRKVKFENDVLLANNVYISDNLHEYENINIPIINQPVKFKKEVTIGAGSWIGENVCIIGASVGRNSVIGCNAVVTNDIDDYCIAVGSPARVIKRFDLNSRQWIPEKDNN